MTQARSTRRIAAGFAAFTALSVAMLEPFAAEAAAPRAVAVAALFSATAVAMAISALISYDWYVATGSGPHATIACAYGATAAVVTAYGMSLLLRPADRFDGVASALWALANAEFVALLGIAAGSQAFFARRERLGESVAEIVRRYVAAVAFGTVFAVLAALAIAPALPPPDDAALVARIVRALAEVAIAGEIAAVVAVLAAIVRLRGRVDLRLAISLAATAAALTLSPPLATWRFTAGWYGAQMWSALAFGTFFVAQFGQIATVLGALARDRRELTAHAGRDALTGLVNRRGFDERFERLWRESRSTTAPFALVIVDIDHFKAYNDRFGHRGGDEALRLVGRALAAAVRRPADLCARIGGEEFALLLPATDLEGATRVAESVRASLEARAVPHPHGQGGRLTASFGVATSADRGLESARELHVRADEALYEAKRQGRNRVSRGRGPADAFATRSRA